MDTTRIQPVGGSHAIEVMAIGVEWLQPSLNDAQLVALQRVYESDEYLHGFLPTFAPVQSFMIEATTPFGVVGLAGSSETQPENVTPPQFTARNGGFDLRRANPNGDDAWVVSVRPEFISVNCAVYDRWQKVRPQALALLKPFVDVALEFGAKISAIGLQYQDAFRLLDGASPVTTGELFRKDGQYLPRNLFDQPSFWHCHQGWFSKAPDGRRILNNAATEVADINGVHFGRIGGQHRLFARSAEGTDPMPIAVSEMDQILQRLHDENITVINGILSDEALVAIGCTKRNA